MAGIALLQLYLIINYTSNAVPLKTRPANLTHVQYFAIAAGVGGALFITNGLRWVKTLIHELKHTAVVLLTGNSLESFAVAKDEGHVTYGLRSDRIHLEPFIILAPYCYPLLSAPVLVLISIFFPTPETRSAILVGFFMGADTISGLMEIHPYQTDIKSIFGGMKLSKVFITITHVFWISTCLVWIFLGLHGYKLVAIESFESSVMVISETIKKFTNS